MVKSISWSTILYKKVDNLWEGFLISCGLLTMLVTPERPSFVTRVPSFFTTTRHGIPDTPAYIQICKVVQIIEFRQWKFSSQFSLPSKYHFKCQKQPLKSHIINLSGVTVFFAELVWNIRVVLYCHPVAMGLLCLCIIVFVIVFVICQCFSAN